MELEQQICSLELAKHIKSLGVNQDSFFEWRRFDCQGLYSEWHWGLFSENIMPDESVPAFTVAELGDMSPTSLEYTAFNGSKDGMLHHLIACSATDQVAKVHADTEADARAKMLISLIENGHIESPIQ